MNCWYFAYGSNMLQSRLGARVGSARPVGVAHLAGYDLRFHKRGTDGSAKCDAFRIDSPDARMFGVLYRMDDREVPVLDCIEGLGRGYRHERATVVTANGVRYDAFFYVATQIDSRLLPWLWYKTLVVAGARSEGLPRKWVRRLQRQPARPDPDIGRELRHRRLLPAHLRGI